MEKTYRQNIDMWSLKCDKDHVLHDTRKPEVSEIRQATIKASDLEYWEELPASAVPPYTKAEYDDMVARLVRERYSESEEFAIQRKALNAMLNPEAATLAEAEGGMAMPAAVVEYYAYNAYVEQCKTRAKDPEIYKPIEPQE